MNLITTFFTNLFNRKYNLNYSKLTPGLATPGGNFSAPYFLAAAAGGAPRRPNWSQNAGRPSPNVRNQNERTERTAAPAEKPHIQHPAKEPTNYAPQHTTDYTTNHTTERTTKRSGTKFGKRSKSQTAAPQIKNRRAKRPPVITATVTGLLLSAIVLLAITGLYGAWCYTKGTHGDASVTASTAMYSLAVFIGCFWAAAVVRRQTKLPCIIIGAAYVICSVVVSAQIFTPADFKILMIIQKTLITAVAGAAGYALSLIPYLIGRATKRK